MVPSRNVFNFFLVVLGNGDAYCRGQGKEILASQPRLVYPTKERNCGAYSGGGGSYPLSSTVPAIFNDCAAPGDKGSGRMRGSKSSHLNEPTAAALPMGHLEKKKGPANVAVYDLAAGNLRYSILEMETGVFEDQADQWRHFLW